MTRSGHVRNDRGGSHRVADSRGFAHWCCIRGQEMAMMLAMIVSIAVAARGDVPLTIDDAPGDAVIRRTDPGGDGPFDPMQHRLPDLVEMRIGGFSPTEPDDDRYIGIWDDDGPFARIDLVFNGVINPPGPLGFGGGGAAYNPMRYGANPVFGFIEFDMDGNENSGGELNAPEYRYLANVARFGGVPAGPEFDDRVATTGHDIDEFLTTPPFVERSGEEFHWSFLGELISHVDVKREMPGGDPQIFEAGEKWLIEGKLLHRAHGFEDFALTCFDAEGEYDVEVKVLFAHSIGTDQTTVSLVYPLTNTAAAALDSPETFPDPNDGCPDDQNSVEEALVDLQFSATIADPATRLLPAFQLIADWENQSPGSYLSPKDWRITALVGTAYPVAEPNSSNLVWTDVYPGPLVGDFDGDNQVGPADALALSDFIALKDGDPSCDGDGDNANGSITWIGFAQDFCVFDINYDGIVDSTLLGDMDLNGVVDIDDLDDFVLALLDADAYTATHGGVLPESRGDVNLDGFLNGLDVGDFANLVLGS